MSPLITISLVGTALLVGLAIGYFVKAGARTGGISFDAYDCATKALTITTSSAMNLFIDALDDTGGSATQPDFPGPNAIEVTVNGHVTVGPLTHENNADKVLICVWAVEKIDNWPRDCSGGGSSSSSGHVVRKSSLKRSVLP